MADTQFVTSHETAVGSANKVLRNTYMLLSMTLVFSAAMAGVSLAMGAPYLGFFPSLIGMIGLLYLVHKCQNSAWGLVAVFAFTGFMGFTLGPLLNVYLARSPELVMTALGLTGMIFMSLSGYVLVTKKDFSFMAGFLMTGLWVVIGSMLLMWGGAYFFNWHIAGLHLAISAAMVFLMSGFILFDTSRIIHGGETNYIMATVSLYMNIYILFTRLLVLLGAMSDD